MDMALDKKTTKILAIETSCDETSASIIEFKEFSNKKLKLKIINNIVSSQIRLHAKYGGVYPELASREHNKNIIPVIQKTLCLNNKPRSLKQSSNLITKQLENIDYLAVTTTPGLIGSLLVGVNTVKTLSYITNKPVIPINHLSGHIYANFIDIDINNQPKFPLLSLVVSGGHTSLYYMKDHFQFELIGETIDDAAGEAYDKVAKMLNLGYPGGPIIDAYASKFKISKPKKLQITNYKPKNLFPRPMLNSKDFNFSFSGLKTSVLYYLRGKKITKKFQEKVAYEFQEAATDVLVTKTLKAAQKYKVKSILLGGGVAANSRLREKIESQTIDYNLQTNIFIPPVKYCTDNAAVIGAAAAYKLLKQKPEKWYDIEANANSEL